MRSARFQVVVDKSAELELADEWLTPTEQESRMQQQRAKVISNRGREPVSTTDAVKDLSHSNQQQQQQQQQQMYQREQSLRISGDHNDQEVEALTKSYLCQS